jgi:hypothetical protein
MTDWAALLDAIDDGLGSFPPVLVEALPADPGPVPAALAERATRTLRRMAEVRSALERERDDIARELVALSAARAARTRVGDGARPVPHFIDQRA